MKILEQLHWKTDGYSLKIGECVQASMIEKNCMFMLLSAAWPHKFYQMKHVQNIVDANI